MANAGKGKIVQDPVHGVIHLDPLAVKIIDTKHFQRLRNIKQISFADYVYPGGTHTRFAHSIGVYHLACKMITKIDEIESFPTDAKKMTESDKKCIRVAALCHDLGHGPFSHIYEHMAKKILKEESGQKRKWKHETMSAKLVENMFKLETLKEELDDKEIALVKTLIQGGKEDNNLQMDKKKKYMFQIVSNKDSGVDVDKWDYFNRDAMACGLLERFQYDRVLSLARIVKTNPDTFELGYRDADALTFYNMFSTRFTLFRRIAHKVKIAVDLMIRDVFRRVQEENNGNCTSSVEVFPIQCTEVTLDDTKLEKYIELTDDILFKIETHETHETYRASKSLLKRIQKRQLYKMIIDIPIKPPPKWNLKKLAEEAEKKIKEMLSTSSLDISKDVEIEPPPDRKDLKKLAEEAEKNIKEIVEQSGLEIPKDVEIEPPPDGKDLKKLAEEAEKNIEKIVEQSGLEIPKDVEIEMVIFDYGSKEKDPVSMLYFYRKEDENTGIKLGKDEVSTILPSVFQEYHLRVYEKFSKGADDAEKLEKLKQLTRTLKEWKQEKTEPAQRENEGREDSNQNDEGRERKAEDASTSMKNKE